MPATDFSIPPTSGNSKIGKWGSRIALLAVTTILCVVVCEWAIRLASPMPVFGPIFDLRPYKKMVLNINLRGVSSPGIHSSNRWGMRGDDPPTDWKNWRTVITIGGSTTQCFHLDDHKTWPYLLQQKLRIKEPKTWVGNAGLDGHSTRAHVMMMDQVIARIHPKEVIVLSGINDLCLSLSDDRRDAGSPYDNYFQSKLHGNGLKAYLMEHSRLYQVAYLWKRVASGDVMTINQAYHKNWFPPPLEGPEALLPDLADLLPSLTSFHDNIIKIDSAAQAIGVHPIFLTQPLLYGTGPEWSKYEARDLWIHKHKFKISAATERRLLDIFNALLLSICSARHMTCYDLASNMPNDTTYYYDQGHFTDAGAERVSDLVSQFMLSTDSSSTASTNL